jgi:hypothetical protein
MKIINIVLLLLLLISSCTALSDRPNSSNISSYKWMKSLNPNLDIFITDDVKKFISKEKIERYVKLKIRNNVKDIKIVNINQRNAWLYFNIELFKYNEKMEIYTGMIECRLHSIQGDKIFTITQSLAGSDTQIVHTIKSHIDDIIEKLATDYYFVQDTK